MRERSGFLAVFLGMSAVLYQIAPSSQTSKPKTADAATVQTSSPAGEERTTDWELLKSLDEFYGLRAPRSGSAATDRKIKIENAGGLSLEATFAEKVKKPVLTDAWWQEHLKYKFDWLIAAVPDPELSGIRLDFDREINAIQNAVESGGYHFDRYFFPWSFRDREGRVSGSGNRSEQDSEREGRRSLPGMLLFRSPEAPSKRDLVVFLVGETPTSGIVPGQFKNAIRFGEFSECQTSIPIAGPGFSGSFDSLARITTSQRYTLRTWTSDYESQKRFKERTGSDLAVVNDSSIEKIKQFCQYLRHNWHEPKSSPIVLLVEESTAFGAGMASSISQEDLGLIYIIKFPRGISKLRNATEANYKISGINDAKGAEILRRELPFTLKEERVGSSELPFFSAEQSPVSQESMLLSVASLLKKGALHYAGIAASDPLDLLFLSRFLRSATPNTRLFTLDSDLLFEHGADGSDFQGILTITNYPLFGFNQIWTRSTKENTVQIFPSGISESIYNAVVQLLPDDQSRPKHYREYGNPFANRFDYLDKDRPPLWITVVGHNGYAPVAVPMSDENPKKTYLAPMPTDQDYRGFMHSRAPQLVPEYWESWGYSFVCIWCLCLSYAAVVLLARPTGNRLFAIFSVKPDENNLLPRAHFLFLLGLCLSVLAALWLAVPYIIFRQNASFLDAKLQTNEWRHHVLLLAFSGVSLFLCLGLFVRRKTERISALTQWCSTSFAAVLAYLLVIHADKLYSQSSGVWASALFHVTFMLVAVAAPVSVLPLGRSRDQTKQGWLSRAWWTILSIAAAITICMVIVICCPPSFIGSSPSLVRLWRLFHTGAVVLGITIASSAVPLLGALHGVRRALRVRTRHWTQLVGSDYYFWFTIAAAIVAAGALLWTAILIHDPTDAPERFLAACRSINLTSGVSPLTPLTLFMLALAVWCFVQLRRISYHEDRCPSVPAFPDDIFCPKLTQVVADVEKRISQEFFHPAYNVISVFAVLLLCCVSVMRDHQTLESPRMDFVMLALALLVGISLITICMRFILIWSAFREFLLQLERHPLREVFSYLPRGFLWVPLWQGGNKKRTHVTVTRSLECVLALTNNVKTPAHLARTLRAQLPELTNSIKELLTFSAERRRVPAAFYRKVQDQLSSIGIVVAMELEQNKWPHGSYEARSELAHRDATKEALRVSKDEFQLEEPYTICSELLALRFVPFINYVLLQLQNLAMYLSAGFILLLTAMHSYVFRAQTVIDWLCAALFIALGGAVLTVFSQLDKDAIFSRITRTEEGKLDRNFVFHMISYGGIPVLALLASHVPSVAKFFFSWIKPAMDAIH